MNDAYSPEGATAAHYSGSRVDGWSHDQVPYDTLSQSFELLNEDEKFWWRATAPSLGQLLASSQYSREDQLTHLRWYRQFIIPALGPHPSKAHFQPCPVFDGSACEHSMNWKEFETARTIRFTIEATGFQAGTATDPFNQEQTKDLLRNMAKEIPDIDLKQFEIFVDEFFLPKEVANSLKAKLPTGTPLSQAWVAFDLLAGKVLPKVYFMPILKWMHTGIPSSTLVFGAAEKCNRIDVTYNDSIKFVKDYLESFTPGQGPVVEMVAIDCIDSPSSRIKVYLRTGVTTLAKAKDQFSLGGRLSGHSINEGLEALSELWPILFRLEGDDINNIEVLPEGSYCGCAIEMKLGQAEPETKLHIPVRKIEGTDAQLCDSLSTWFRSRGHEELAERYKSDLSAAL